MNIITNSISLESCDSSYDLAGVLAVRLVSQVLDEADIIVAAAQETGQPWRYVSALKNLKGMKLAEEDIADYTYFGSSELDSRNVSEIQLDSVASSVATSTPQKTLARTSEINNPNKKSSFIGQDEDMDAVPREQNTSKSIKNIYDMSVVEKVSEDIGITKSKNESKTLLNEDMVHILESCINYTLHTTFGMDHSDDKARQVPEYTASVESFSNSGKAEITGAGKDTAFLIDDSRVPHNMEDFCTSEAFMDSNVLTKKFYQTGHDKELAFQDYVCFNLGNFERCFLNDNNHSVIEDLKVVAIRKVEESATNASDENKLQSLHVQEDDLKNVENNSVIACHSVISNSNPLDAGGHNFIYPEPENLKIVALQKVEELTANITDEDISNYFDSQGVNENKKIGLNCISLLESDDVSLNRDSEKYIKDSHGAPQEPNKIHNLQQIVSNTSDKNQISHQSLRQSAENIANKKEIPLQDSQLSHRSVADYQDQLLASEKSHESVTNYQNQLHEKKLSSQILSELAVVDSDNNALSLQGSQNSCENVSDNQNQLLNSKISSQILIKSAVTNVREDLLDWQGSEQSHESVLNNQDQLLERKISSQVMSESADSDHNAILLQDLQHSHESVPEIEDQLLERKTSSQFLSKSALRGSDKNVIPLQSSEQSNDSALDNQDQLLERKISLQILSESADSDRKAILLQGLQHSHESVPNNEDQLLERKITPQTDKNGILLQDLHHSHKSVLENGDKLLERKTASQILSKSGVTNADNNKIPLQVQESHESVPDNQENIWQVLQHLVETVLKTKKTSYQDLQQSINVTDSKVKSFHDLLKTAEIISHSNIPDSQQKSLEDLQPSPEKVLYTKTSLQDLEQTTEIASQKEISLHNLQKSTGFISDCYYSYSAFEQEVNNEDNYSTSYKNHNKLNSIVNNEYIGVNHNQICFNNTYNTLIRDLKDILQKEQELASASDNNFPKQIIEIGNVLNTAVETAERTILSKQNVDVNLNRDLERCSKTSVQELNDSELQKVEELNAFVFDNLNYSYSFLGQEAVINNFEEIYVTSQENENICLKRFQESENQSTSVPLHEQESNISSYCSSPVITQNKKNLKSVEENYIETHKKSENVYLNRNFDPACQETKDVTLQNLKELNAIVSDISYSYSFLIQEIENDFSVDKSCISINKEKGVKLNQVENFLTNELLQNSGIKQLNEIQLEETYESKAFASINNCYTFSEKEHDCFKNYDLNRHSNTCIKNNVTERQIEETKETLQHLQRLEEATCSGLWPKVDSIQKSDMTDVTPYGNVQKVATIEMPDETDMIPYGNEVFNFHWDTGLKSVSRPKLQELKDTVADDCVNVEKNYITSFDTNDTVFSRGCEFESDDDGDPVLRDPREEISNEVVSLAPHSSHVVFQTIEENENIDLVVKERICSVIKCEDQYSDEDGDPVLRDPEVTPLLESSLLISSVSDKQLPTYFFALTTKNIDQIEEKGDNIDTLLKENSNQNLKDDCGQGSEDDDLPVLQDPKMPDSQPGEILVKDNDEPEQLIDKTEKDKNISADSSLTCDYDKILNTDTIPPDVSDIKANENDVCIDNELIRRNLGVLQLQKMEKNEIEEITRNDMEMYEKAYLSLNRDDEQAFEDDGDAIIQDLKTAKLDEVELVNTQISGPNSSFDAGQIQVTLNDAQLSVKPGPPSGSRKTTLVRRCRLQGARLWARLRGWWRRKTPGKRREERGRGADAKRALCALSPDARRRATSLEDQRFPVPPESPVTWKFNTVNEVLVNSTQWKEYTFELKPDDCGELGTASN